MTGVADEIVVAHDYLTQRGGAERVALELARRLDAKSVVTSAYVREQTFAGFEDFAVRTSPSLALRVLRKDPRRALPFLPGVWDRMAPVDADAVVCSSSGWSHAIPVGSSTAKIVYCHNPARWLYQSGDYLLGASSLAKAALALLKKDLLAWDAKAAQTADAYIANSSSVAARVRRVYGIDPVVVFPPVSIDPNGSQRPIDGAVRPFFLTVGRVRGYKGTASLIEAFAGMPDEQLVVVGAEHETSFPPNVVGAGYVSDAQLRWAYRSAQALISVSREDFGLTPLEANSLGTPALVLRAGGFLDSTSEGVSGEFIESESIDDIRRAVRSFSRVWDERAIKAHAGRFSPEAFVEQVRTVIRDVRVG